MTNKKTKLISGITATVVVASAVGIGVGTSFAINSEREVDQLRAISNAKIFPILKQMPFGGVENSSNPIKFLEAFNAKRLDTNLSPNALPIWNNSNFVSFDIVEMAKISGISETVLDNFSFKVEKAIISNANPNNLNLTIIVVSKNDSTLFTKYEILISDFLSEESYIQKAADIISTKIRTSNITTTNLIAQRTLASKVIASQLSDFIRDNIPFNNLVDANDISYAFEILSSNDNLGNIEAKITIIPRFSIERIVLESITLNGFSTTTNQEIIQIQNNIQNASELSFNFTPQAEILTIDNVNSNNIQNLAKLTQNPNPGLKYEIQTDSLIINKETNLINFDVLISDASGRNVETTKRYKTSVTFRPFTIFAFDQLDFVIKGEKLNQFLSQELNTLDFVPATNPNSNLTYTVQSTRIISFNSVLLTIRVVQNNTSNSQTYETIVNAGFSSIQNRQNAILTLIKEQEPAPISKIVLENTLASNVHPSNFNNPDFSNIIPLSLRNLPNFFPAITYSILNSDNANGTLDLRVNVSLPGMPQIGYTSKFNTLKSNDFVQNLIQLISNRKLSPILKTLTPSITIPTISLESIANDLVAPNQAQLMSGNNRITLPEGAVVTFEINRNTGTQGVLNPNDINGTLDISINFTLKLLGDVAIYQGNYTVTMTGFSSQELRNLENIAKFQSLGLRPIYNNPSVLASNLLPSNINLNNLNQFQVPVFDQVAFPDLTLRIKSILNPNNVLGSIDVTVEQKIIKNGITTTRDNVITIFGFRTESADNALSVITNYINTINGSDGQVVIKFKNTVNPNETLIASLTQNDVDFEPFNFGENELFPSLSAEVSAIRINPQDPTIAQILILVKSNVLVNGQNVQQVYIQNIPGFAPQEFIINREILKQYIENGNLSNTLISPILLPTIVKNLTLPNTVSLSSFETTTLSDPSNPNINLRLIGVAQGVVNPITNPPVATSVVATISASLGTGDSVVTQTYIVTIEGFATPIGMANQTIANNEVANIASRAVASLRDEAKKTLSVSQLLPSDFNLRYPANSTSIVPISDLSITQIEADPNDSTIAVLTIQVIIRVNSFNNSLNFGIATYTQKIPGFLNQDSGRIALGFRDLALNANDLIIFNGIKGDTGVDAAIQSGKDNFTINSPIGFENIIFSIQDFDSTSTNASRGELGFVIKGEFNGQILLSSTINQKIVVSEFLAENLAILNAATEFGVILKPEFNLNSNRPTASQASKDNFSINFSQAPDPRVEYEITNLVQGGEGQVDGNTVTLTIIITVIGTNVSRTYNTVFNGLATQSFVNNRTLVNAFISTPDFNTSILSEGDKNKAVLDLVADDFTINNTDPNIRVQISKIEPSALSSTTASITLSISTGKDLDVFSSDVIITKIGFSNPTVANNRRLIENYLSSSDLQKPFYVVENNILPEFVAANSLSKNNFAIKAISGAFSVIKQEITNLTLQVGVDPAIATSLTLTVEYSLGEGANRATIIKEYEIQGFATAAKATNFELLNRYMTSGNLSKPVFQPGFFANEVDILTVQTNINRYLTTNPLDGIFRPIVLTLDSIIFEQGSETTGIVTVRASNGIGDDIASETYEVRIEGFLTAIQNQNAIIALNYRNNLANRRVPQLNDDIVRATTAASNLTINSFNIAQPNPNPSNIRLSITRIILPEGISPAEATSVEVEVTIFVGNGNALSNTIKYTTSFAGFANLARELNNAALNEYIKSPNRLIPNLVPTIEKNQVSANSIVVSNLIFPNNQGSIATMQNNITINLSIGSVNVSPNNPNAIIIVINASAGTQVSNIVRGTYSITIDGFANEAAAINFRILNNYVQQLRQDPKPINPNIFLLNSADSAAPIVRDLFTIDSPFIFNGTNINLRIERGISIPSDNLANTTLEVRISASIGNEKIEYGVRFTQFASLERQNNINDVNNYIDNVNNRARAMLNPDATNLSTFEARNNNFTLINSPLASTGLNLVITSVSPKTLNLGDSLLDQTTAIVTISVTKGIGPNVFTRSYTVEVVGFKTLQFGINKVSTTNYINGSNLIRPTAIDPLIATLKSAFQLLSEEFTIDSFVNVAPPAGIIPNDPVTLNLKILSVAPSQRINDGTFAEFDIEVSVGVFGQPDYFAQTYKVELGGFLSNANFLINRFINSDPRPTFLKMLNGLNSNNRNQFLPSTVSEHDFSAPYIAGPNSTSEFTNGLEINLINLTLTLEIVNRNDQQGTLTLKIIVASGNNNSILTIIFSDFLTLPRKAVNDAPELEYELNTTDSDFKNKNSAPIIESDYRLANPNLVPAEVSYLIQSMTSLNDGESVELQITIRSMINPNISKTYTKTISGFLTTQKALNLRTLDTFINTIDRNGFAPTLQAGVNQKTAINFVTEWNSATPDQRNRLLSFNPNPQVNLVQRIDSIEVSVENDINVTILVQVTSGTGPDAATSSYSIQVGAFLSAGDAAVVALRSSISSAHLNKEAIQNHYFTPNGLSKNKLLISQNTIDKNDVFLDVDKIRKLANERQNQEINDVTVSFTINPLTRQNGLTGELSIEVTLEFKGQSQKFSIIVYGFETTNSLVSAYVRNEANRRKPILKSTFDKWTSLALVSKGDYEFNESNIPTQIDGQFLKISLNTIIINASDPSIVNFTIEVSMNVASIYEGINVILEDIQTYNFQISGFRKPQFQANEAIRVQYNENSEIVNGYFSQEQFNTKFDSPTDIATITRIEFSGIVTAIGNEQFKSATNLVELILSEGLISIGTESFRDAKLNTLRLPSTLVSIGQNAFKSSLLTGLTFMQLNLANTKVNVLNENVFAGAINNTVLIDDIHNWKFNIVSKFKVKYKEFNHGNNESATNAVINRNNFKYEVSDQNIIDGNNITIDFGILSSNTTRGIVFFKPTRKITTITNNQKERRAEKDEIIYGFQTTIRAAIENIGAQAFFDADDLSKINFDEKNSSKISSFGSSFAFGNSNNLNYSQNSIPSQAILGSNGSNNKTIEHQRNFLRFGRGQLITSSTQAPENYVLSGNNLELNPVNEKGSIFVVIRNTTNGTDFGSVLFGGLSSLHNKSDRKEVWAFDAGTPIGINANNLFLGTKPNWQVVEFHTTGVTNGSGTSAQHQYQVRQWVWDITTNSMIQRDFSDFITDRTLINGKFRFSINSLTPTNTDVASIAFVKDSQLTLQRRNDVANALRDKWINQNVSGDLS